MADKFSAMTEGLSSPPSDLIAVAPSDSTDLAHVSRAINVATAGTVRVTTRAGTTASISVAAGIIVPIRVRRIWATGTTATGIVALF
jgi:hypothetical protein